MNGARSSPSRSQCTASPHSRAAARRRPQQPLSGRGAEVLSSGRAGPGGRREVPAPFSGGQRQRISIARALATQPEFLFSPIRPRPRLLGAGPGPQHHEGPAQRYGLPTSSSRTTWRWCACQHRGRRDVPWGGSSRSPTRRCCSPRRATRTRGCCSTRFRTSHITAARARPVQARAQSASIAERLHLQPALPSRERALPVERPLLIDVDGTRVACTRRGGADLDPLDGKPGRSAQRSGISALRASVGRDLALADQPGALPGDHHLGGAPAGVVVCSPCSCNRRPRTDGTCRPGRPRARGRGRASRPTRRSAHDVAAHRLAAAPLACHDRHPRRTSPAGADRSSPRRRCRSVSPRRPSYSTSLSSTPALPISDRPGSTITCDDRGRAGRIRSRRRPISASAAACLARVAMPSPPPTRRGRSARRPPRPPRPGLSRRSTASTLGLDLVTLRADWQSMPVTSSPGRRRRRRNAASAWPCGMPNLLGLQAVEM